MLRGNPFEWEGKWPHLPADEAARLIGDVIDRYTKTMKRRPRRLVVHKQSRFFPEELTGFQDALTGYEYDLVALAPSTGVRLMRHGQYPPPRGACLSLGDAATSTRPGTSPHSAATRTATSRPRCRSPTTPSLKHGHARRFGREYVGRGRSGHLYH